MTEQNEREIAKEKAWNIDHHRFLDNEGIPYDAGFNAGYAAGQPQWIAVSERLPKEPGPYLFEQIGGDNMFDVLYLGLNTISDKADYLRSHYVAWQPIQHYTKSDNTEVSDD